MYNTGCGHLYITVNIEENGVLELFSYLGKAGNCAHCQLEALTRAISMGLSYGVPITEYIGELKDIKCQAPAWDQGQNIQSCPDAIAKALEKARITLSGKTSGCEGEEIRPKSEDTQGDDN